MTKLLPQTVSADNQAAGVTVLLNPHPFTTQCDEYCLPEGLTVADILRHLMPDTALAKQIQADLNGQVIAPRLWKNLRPKKGTTLRFILIPMGGGHGKSPLRTIISLALIAASPALAGAVAGALGTAAEATFLGISVGRLVATGINLVSQLALNALAPPGKPRLNAVQKESPTLFLQGARNQATPFGRVPKVLGRHRFVPPLGALPYTETVGDDQYLRMLFVWGYGPLHISDLKIGETPLSAFEDIEIETRHGQADDAPITLYTDSVLQNDLHVALKQSDGYVLRTTETDADEISVDVTLPHGLLVFNNNGGRLQATVQVEVQYAPTGTEDWTAAAGSYSAKPAATLTLDAAPVSYQYIGVPHVIRRCDVVVMDAASGALRCIKGDELREETNGTNNVPLVPLTPLGFLALARIARASNESAGLTADNITDLRAPLIAAETFEHEGDFAVTPYTGKTLSIAAGGLRFNGFSLTGKQSTALRKNISFKVQKGQYDVRLRRLTPDATDQNTFDETAWTALRTIRYTNPVTMQGLAMTALRIKATDQLNGVVEKFNGIVQSILPDWNGTDWVTQPTANPAALYRHILQGSANARPLADARLDIDSLTQWHEDCATAGREYNAVIDYDTAVRDVLRDVAAAGRASPALQDGKWSVVQDKPQNVPLQHFTPRNSFHFEGQKAFHDFPQALRVRFINRDKGWLQDERLVYDDGFTAANATRYETLELPGITSAAQAWQDGRYHIATARLRPETYSFSCDLEHLVCTRGDLIRLTHDVPLFGLVSARVKAMSYDTAGEKIISVTLDAKAVMEADKRYTLRFRTDTGASLTVSAAAIEGEDGHIVVSPPLPADGGLKIGDLAVFGESGQESVEMIVKSILPQGDLAARITCVDAAPAVHFAGTGALPAFNSHINLPPSMRRPPAPRLVGIQSGEEALIRNTDGSLGTRILITLAAPNWAGNLSTQVMLRAAGESNFRLADVTAQGPARLAITDIAEGETYDIRLRHISTEGTASDSLFIHGHRVEGTSALPADVTGLTVSILGATAHLSWLPVRDLDLDHYTLRFSVQTSGALWSNAIDVVSHIPMDATSLSVPAVTGTYLLKAVDIGGRYSANPAGVLANTAGIAGYNAVMTLAEGPYFTGQSANMILNDGALRLGGQDSIDDWNNIDNISNTDIGENGLAREGSYVFASPADLGAVYTARLTANFSVYGFDFNASLDSWGNLDLVEDFDQTVNPGLWSLQLLVRSTQDDPADMAAVWTGWSPFVVGDYTARGFSFCLKVSTLRNNITPAITALGVQIDMPDRITAADNIASDAAGATVTFAKAFRATPALLITPHDMTGTDYYSVTAKTPQGFHIRFFDSSDAGVVRHFDYVAQGFGQEF